MLTKIQSHFDKALIERHQKYLAMRKVFKNRLEGIDWIAANAEDEGHFEVLREELNFNFIYTGKYFIDIDGSIKEVVLLNNDIQE